MPPPIDLTGRKIGRLTVISRAPALVSATGKSKHPAWLCQCDCGRQEVLPQHRLPYTPSNAARSDAADQCTHCKSQRICTVCSRPFESLQHKATCSETCRRAHKQAIWREHYYRLIERNPKHNIERNQTVRTKAATDPELAVRLKRIEQRAAEKHKRRMETDPEYRAREQAAARERYQRTAEATQARRREQMQARLAAMTPEEYEAWAERRRLYARAYAARRRQEPAVRERYRNTMREYLRQQALRGLASQADELIKKQLKDNEP